MGKTKKHKRPKKTLGAKVFTWVAVASVVGLVLYGLSQVSSIAYTEKDIAAVNFDGLSATQKRTALEAANRARCTCGCGLGLAECVATDLTCPIRETNIGRIKTMVKEAMVQ